MVKFELLDESDVPGATSERNEYQTWCMDIAAIECKRFSRPMPAVQFKRRNVSSRWVDVSEAEYNQEPERERTIYTGRHWVRRSGTLPKSSSGTTYGAIWRAHAGGHNIIVRTGTDPEHARLVFLHELAHWLAPDYDAHGVAFFRLAFTLYERYGIDMERAIQDEKRYKKRAATKAARRYEGRVSD